MEGTHTEVDEKSPIVSEESIEFSTQDQGKLCNKRIIWQLSLHMRQRKAVQNPEESVVIILRATPRHNFYEIFCTNFLPFSRRDTYDTNYE